MGLMLAWFGFVAIAVGVASHALKPKLKWAFPLFILGIIFWKIGMNY